LERKPKEQSRLERKPEEQSRLERKPKEQSRLDNPKKQATLDTRHRAKSNKINNTTHKTDKMSNMDIS
jgi:hypothetical protein